MTTRVESIEWAPPAIPAPAVPVFPDLVEKITDHGAVADGRTPATEAIAGAIGAAAAAGGGTVLVPPGDFLSGPIHLRSGVRLHLESGATIRFSTEPSDYLPVVFTRWEGVECHNYSPLIYAKECEDIAVTGEGVLDGQGEAWWHWKQLQHAAVKFLYDAQGNGVEPPERVFGVPEALRPQFFQPINCRRVLLEGVTFRNGPMWTVHPVYCRDVTVRGIRVESVGPNTDGLNPDSCSGVLIEDCSFDTGDDSIAINSGMNDDGWRVARPCENIEIRRCSFERSHGCIVIGSGMSGDVRNVYAHDCECNGSDRGLRIKSIRGRGGVVEDVWAENLRMKGIAHEVILVSMFYAASSAPPQTSAAPTFRRIHVRNVRCDGADTAVVIHGLEDSPIRDVALDDIEISARRPVECSHVSGLRVGTLKIRGGE